MNETNAKILQFVIIFWLVLIAFATVFGNRMGTYFLDDTQTEDLKSISLTNGISVLWKIGTFQITENVPFLVTILLDIIVILTGIAILMAIFNR